jgi:flagellar biosynthesis/type III secretory pathway chaperone
MNGEKKVLSRKELAGFDLQALSEMKNSLFEQVADRKSSKRVLRELFNVLDVLQEKRLQKIDRLALLEAEKLPIECIA